jgi:hypothetical protein
MLTFETVSLLLLFVAEAALLVALVAFPRTKTPSFRIEKVTFHDGVVTFYPMKRTMWGWKNFQVEEGVRGYRSIEEARDALEGYLSQELNLEISESEVVKEYG